MIYFFYFLVQSPATPTAIENHYGTIKYINETTKTSNNPIASLKSHLEFGNRLNTTSINSTTPISDDFDTDSFKKTLIKPRPTFKANLAANDSESVGKVTPEVLWPVKREAVVEGDLVLGGLMMVHEREDSITCGPIMPQGGIQALEAMLYTLDRLNFAANPLLPNITIGAHILDDCDKDTYGLEMAVDFIKGKERLFKFNTG